MSTSEADQLVYAVDPARLRPGGWCRRRQRMIGEGDIAAAYSADKIGMGAPVRKPFEWQGSLWVTVGTNHLEPSAKAYRLIDPAVFDGEPTTYGAKTRDSEAARRDPLGFYHGLSVRQAGRTLLLCGPPALFVEGESEQLDLFGAA
jgi:hypothetical protein